MADVISDIAHLPGQLVSQIGEATGLEVLQGAGQVLKGAADLVTLNPGSAAENVAGGIVNTVGGAVHDAFNIAGKVVASPDSAIGTAAAILGGSEFIGIGHNALEFQAGPGTAAVIAQTFGPGVVAITSGNVIIYMPGCRPGDLVQGAGSEYTWIEVGSHEEGHTYQFEWLGPLYSVIYLVDPNNFERDADDYAAQRGKAGPKRGQTK